METIMKQLLATGLIALFCALVVSAGWPESATELGHTASNAQVAVAALFTHAPH